MATYNPANSLGTYSSNQSLFVFSSKGPTGANFLGTISWTPGSVGLTTSYYEKGGVLVGTTGELVQYIGNKAFLSYQKKDKTTGSELLPIGGITSVGDSSLPDPRREIGIFCDGSESSVTGEHMDEIHISANDGSTFQAFLARIQYASGSTLIPANTLVVDLCGVGVSGTDRVFPGVNVGATLENKVNGITATISSSSFRRYIRLNDIGNKVKSQFLSGVGMTGITVGNASTLRHIKISPFDKDLQNFIQNTLPLATSTGISGDASRKTSIYVPYGFSGADAGASLGVDLSIISGGTVENTSIFEEFAIRVLNAVVEGEISRNTTIQTIDNTLTVRGLDNIVGP